MKSGSRAALALGAGYVLGRRRKLRLTMIVGVAAVAGAGGIGGQLARRGIKLARSADLLGKVPPELTEIGGVLRHDLVSAGKDAAKTAMNSRIDSLSDRLRDRADAWRNPEGTMREVTSGRGHDDEPSDDEPGDDERGEGEEESEEAEAGPRPRGRARRQAGERRASERRAGGRQESRRRPDEGDTPSRPVRRARSSAGSAGAASPSRRTGR